VWDDVMALMGGPGDGDDAHGDGPATRDQLARNERMAVAISSALRVPTSRSHLTSVGSSSMSSTTARRSSGIVPKRAS
jgi:hypothetical protein